MKSAVLGFDLDGTVLDSTRRHIKVLEDCLEITSQADPRFVFNDFIKSKREGASTLYYLKNKGIDDAPYIAAQWESRIEEDNYLDLDVPYPDAFPVLSMLNNDHVMFLVTARKNATGAFRQFRTLGLDKYFSDIIIVKPGANAGKEKADATKNLGLGFVIGDSETDLEWSDIVTARFIALHRGFRSEAYWNARNVSSYQSLSSILDIVKESSNPPHGPHKDTNNMQDRHSTDKPARKG